MSMRESLLTGESVLTADGNDDEGGTGTIDRITSTDGTVVVTNPTGPTVDLSVPSSPAVIAKFTGYVLSGESPIFGYLADPGQTLLLDAGVPEPAPQLYPTGARIFAAMRVTATGGGIATTSDYTVTLYKNGAPTAQQVTVPHGAAAGTVFKDIAHPITFADDDKFDVRWDVAAGDGSKLFLAVTLEGPGSGGGGGGGGTVASDISGLTFPVVAGTPTLTATAPVVLPGAHIGATYSQLLVQPGLASLNAATGDSVGLNAGGGSISLGDTGIDIASSDIGLSGNTKANGDVAVTGTFEVNGDPLVAPWALGAVRWYALDTAAGNDANAGFSDASSAAAGAVAKKTMAGLAAIFPNVGAGRKVVIRIGAGDYTGQGGLDTVLGSSYGWAAGFPLVLPTVTNSTSGAVAFAGTVADKIQAGFVTVPGLNAGGYTPVAGATQSTVPCIKNGGGAPGFPAEPAEPLGWRIRFDATTSTVALRNVGAMILGIATTTTTNDTLLLPSPATGAGGLPAVPSATDVFYVEKAGVTVDQTIMSALNTNNTSAPRPGVLQFVGINFNGEFGVLGGNRVVLCGCSMPFLVLNQRTDPTLGYTDETNTARIVGSTVRVTTSIQAGGGNSASLAALGANEPIVCLGAITLSTAQQFNVSDGSYVGGGIILFNCKGDVTPNPAGPEALTLIGGRTINSQSPIRLIGVGAGPSGSAQLVIFSSDITTGRVTSSNAGANPAIQVLGKSSLSIGAFYTGSTGNTDVGLDLTHSCGSTIVIYSVPTVTGTAGDIRLANGQIVTWAAVAATGLVDTAGNRFISATSPLGIVAKFSFLATTDSGAATFSYLPDIGYWAGLVGVVTNIGTPILYPTSQRLITRLRAVASGGTGPQPPTFTLYKNGVATAMSCTLPANTGAPAAAADLAHPVLFADGDQFDVRVDFAATTEGDIAVAAVIEGPC